MSIFEMLTQRSYVWPAYGAAVAVGLVCSLLSVIVVLKRMAFIGQGISHAGFGGVGTAALLGLAGMSYRWEQDAVVALFCLATAIGIGIMTRRRRVEVDAAIGILLAATMAWGVIMQNLRVVLQAHPWYRRLVGGGGYTPPWEQILFGSPWTVGQSGMWTAVVLCLIVLVVCGLLYRQLLFFTFDERVSQVHGVRSGAMYFLLLIMLALVIVVSIRLVGFILVSALLIVPGASALQVSRRMGVVLALSATIGVGGTLAGLTFSLAAGSLSPGACIVLMLFVLFLAAQLVARVRLRQRRARRFGVNGNG
jgi:ABC-type Mn2+/Zn2+ transport system permease subunit